MYNYDANEIGEELYSPTFGYPPQRIASYDVPLRGHITLTGLSGAGVLAPVHEQVSRAVGQQVEWQQESDYLQGLVGDGESLEWKKERRYTRVFGY